MTTLSLASPAPLTPVARTPQIATGGLTRLALIISLALGSALGGAAFMPIDGAIIAEGRVLVEGRPQAVQSLDPGIVTHVAVRNGDHVKAGQLLLELDSATSQARLDIALERLSVALAEQARLDAEASARNHIDFTPPPLPFEAPDMTRAALRQQALFAARQRQIADATARLEATRAQYTAQMSGIEAQLEATRTEAALLDADIARQQDMVSQGLSRQSPLADLQRQRANMTGRLAQLEADLQRLRGSLHEAELAFSEVQSRRAEEVAIGLRDRNAEIQQIRAEIMSLTEALARTQLRAPVDGIVHDLSVPAAGSVITAGTALAQIMPQGRDLEIEAQIDPADIDRLHEGQSAEIMLTAFDMRNAPRLMAQVTHLPPDAVRHPQTGASFYRVTLTLDPASLPENLALRAGMGAQVFVTTGSRSLLDWLLAPLTLPMAMALREG